MSKAPFEWAIQPGLPPADAVAVYVAVREFFMGEPTLRKLNLRGDIDAWPDRASNGRPCIRLSRSQLKAYVASNITNLKSSASLDRERTTVKVLRSIPVGANFICTLAKELKISPNTLQEHCDWDSHPALGRKAKSGFGTGYLKAPNGEKRTWRGQWMMEADAVAIARALQERPEQKRYPGVPGVWHRVVKFAPPNSPKSVEGIPRIEGVFLHDDGRRFLTEGYIAAHHGFARGEFNLDSVVANSAQRAD